mgnify:CR=1 FL=1
MSNQQQPVNNINNHNASDNYEYTLSRAYSSAENSPKEQVKVDTHLQNVSY